MTGHFIGRRTTFIPVTSEAAPATASSLSHVMGSIAEPRDPNTHEAGTGEATSGILVASPPRSALTHVNRMHAAEVTR